jgi:hypothetical protein
MEDSAGQQVRGGEHLLAGAPARGEVRAEGGGVALRGPPRHSEGDRVPAHLC